MKVSLDHINMSVENLEQSLNWYDQVFGFQTVEKGDHKGTAYAIIQNHESMLCLYELPNRAQPESSTTHKVYHFGLRIHDPKAWEDHLRQLKITPHLIWDYPHSQSWYLEDPSGHEIEVTYWQNDKIQFDPMTS